MHVSVQHFRLTHEILARLGQRRREEESIVLSDAKQCNLKYHLLHRKELKHTDVSLAKVVLYREFKPPLAQLSSASSIKAANRPLSPVGELKFDES